MTVNLKGINVVGMTPERAWQIALATTPYAVPEVSDRAKQIIDLTEQGYMRKDIIPILGITAKQYDNARAAARRHGLI